MTSTWSTTLMSSPRSSTRSSPRSSPRSSIHRVTVYQPAVNLSSHFLSCHFPTPYPPFQPGESFPHRFSTRGRITRCKQQQANSCKQQRRGWHEELGPLDWHGLGWGRWGDHRRVMETQRLVGLVVYITVSLSAGKEIARPKLTGTAAAG